MKLINLLAAFSLILFIGCGGGDDAGDQQQAEEPMDTQEQEMGGEVRTFDLVGIDAMQFVVEEEADGITAGEEMGEENLLRVEDISASPGEEIRIRLETQSDMPASAMAHNWVLLTMDSDPQAFADAAANAQDDDYIPSDMEDQIVAQTEMAAGGETTEVTFTVPEEPGEYEFVCTFPGHYAAGMRGTLTVE